MLNICIMIGQKIHQLRFDRGMGKADLARELGMTRYTIDCWENDRYMPTWANLKRLADFFDVSVYFLLYGDRMDPLTITRAKQCLEAQGIGPEDIAREVSKRFYTQYPLSTINAFLSGGFDPRTLAYKVIRLTIWESFGLEITGS